MNASEWNDLIRRAEDLAGDSFDSVDKDAQAWLHDHIGYPEYDAFVFAAIRGTEWLLAKDRLRDMYIAEREHFYRDEARDDIEAAAIMEE